MDDGSSDPHGVHTIQETAEHFGVSRQRIVDIERRALRKLRLKLEELGIRGMDAFKGSGDTWNER